MTVPNPNAHASQPGQQSGQQPGQQPGYPGPSGTYPGASAQPFAQPGGAGGYGGYQQQPYVPPVYDTAPPKPPRPKLTKAAAHRARLAGGVGGGIAWLGLGITQVSAMLLLLPLIVGAVIYGIGFAVMQDGSSVTADAWEQTLAWLGSPGGIALAIGIPAGILIALLGLWISTRILRHPDLRRPAGVTWAGFGIALVAAMVLSGFGSITLPFFGGVPFGGDLDFDRGGFGSGPMDETQVQEWFAQGGGDLLERIGDPGTLLALLGPWIAIAHLLALIVPIIVSIFTWWWMAHAMRPAAPAGASTTSADGAQRA